MYLCVVETNLVCFKIIHAMCQYLCVDEYFDCLLVTLFVPCCKYVVGLFCACICRSDLQEGAREAMIPPPPLTILGGSIFFIFHTAGVMC